MKAPYDKYLFTLLTLLVVSLTLQAQTSYILAPGSEFTVSGTSSLHDWEMTSQDAKGEAIIRVEDKALKNIEKLSIELKAETLKSGRSGMDGKAYKALKTKNNPDIGFNLKRIKSMVKKDDHYLVEAEGTLTVAGAIRPIDLQAKAVDAVNAVTFTGSKTFKMTDFKIDPPTALLGTVKTGDMITINYNLTFKSK